MELMEPEVLTKSHWQITREGVALSGIRWVSGGQRSVCRWVLMALPPPAVDQLRAVRAARSGCVAISLVTFPSITFSVTAHR